MDSNNTSQSEAFLRQQPPPKKLSLLPLIFLIYFEVSGGPYGVESTVGAAGPLFSLLGFLVFPFLWSVPEALLTAELSSAFPSNGGFVLWAHSSFGPFWGSLLASWKLFSGVINLASFPVLCIDYLQLALPSLSSGVPRYLSILASTLLLSLLNYLGLAIVGYTAISLGLFTLSPFVALSVVSIPKIDPRRWVSLGQTGVKKDWSLFFNTLFWNLNFWDNASALAGEVQNPQKNFPKALLYAGLLCGLAYFIPLLAATGALPLDQSQWYEGSFAEIAGLIAGNWLKIWVELGAVCSGIGLYEAQLSSCAYQVVGMADLGVVPKAFGVCSVRFNTPWLGILIPTVFTLAVACMDFDNIIYTVNFLYSLGMLLEFASFLRLRSKFGAAKRPFRVPLELPWLAVMCLVPSAFLLYVMAVATKTVYLISLVLTLVGVASYFVMNLCKSRMWFEFNSVSVGGEDDLQDE